jgi:acetylornithine deacetylase/succinyl-diaminopimelate desuccinylase-like protein
VSGLDRALDFLASHREEFLAEWKELVSIPSVSTDPDHRTDIDRAARWLVDRLTEYGAAESRLIESSGHPVVWAEFPAGPEAPTVLIYGHYDVQPTDPIELWETDPFVPTVRNGRLYGRGASDMKAQVMATLLAVRAAAHAGPLPVTVRVLLEGEEEIGSPSLAAVIEEHRDRFRADVCFNPDTSMLGPETPSIRYGLRGLAYFELTVSGPARDLHSGAFGGVVHNPAQALAELIAAMHDETGRITLPGFYDRVRPIDARERERSERVPTTDDGVLALTGVPALWGEPEYPAVERIGARPTLEINGIWGGYTGPGAKTVIPAEAHAKISMRLVPDQRAGEVRGQLEAYLREHAPATIRWELTELAGGDPFICDPDSPAHAAFAGALRDVWGVEPILSRNGGSVPVASDLERLLGMPSVLGGFGLPDDRIHSPNESQHLETWYRGMEAITRFLYRFAERDDCGAPDST